MFKEEEEVTSRNKSILASLPPVANIKLYFEK